MLCECYFSTKPGTLICVVVSEYHSSFYYYLLAPFSVKTCSSGAANALPKRTRPNTTITSQNDAIIVHFVSKKIIISCSLTSQGFTCAFFGEPSNYFIYTCNKLGSSGSFIFYYLLTPLKCSFQCFLSPTFQMMILPVVSLHITSKKISNCSIDYLVFCRNFI